METILRLSMGAGRKQPQTEGAPPLLEHPPRAASLYCREEARHARCPALAAFHVADLEASVRFYRDGLGVALERNEHPVHEEISWHDPYFHFALFPKEAPREPALGLFVEDLDTAHDRLVAMAAKVDRAPYEAPWGREARYLDPDGNLVSLTERKTHHTRGQ